jgi:hypothetical protein
MNSFAKSVVVQFVLLLAVVSSPAIEGLKLSVQCQDVVLTWPSVEGEIYIVQYRPTLDTNSTWETLIASLPAEAGATNTTFIHSNVVQMAKCSSAGGSFAALAMMGAENSVLAESEIQTAPPEPMAVPNIGGGEAVPLKLFPDGFDLSAYTIVDPLTEAVVSGAAFMQASSSLDPSGPPEEGGGATNGSAGFLSETGFYRVVRNGVHLFGLTNEMVLSGVRVLPIELGLDPSAVPLGVGLAPDDEVPQPPGIQLYTFTGTNDSPHLVWDTHLAPNGTYMLAPSAFLIGGESVSGAVFTVNVSNAIQVPLSFDFMGSGLPILATIASNNAPYQITVRNEADDVVRTLSGTADGYEIINYWDGLDEFGNDMLTNDFVTTTISYNPSYRKTNWIEKAGTITGSWLISYQDNLFSSVNQTSFENNMGQVVTFANDHGGVVLGGKFEIGRGAGDWSALYTYIPQARNIYFYGHGGPNAIGFGPNDPDYGARASGIRAVLRNRFHREDIRIRHPYRFAFLDGCESGSKDSEWPASFGIMPAQLSATDFTALGLPNRAFLGWKKKIVTATFDTSRHTFVLNFFTEWLDNEANLSAALATAATGTIGSGELSKLQIWGDVALPPQ